MTQHTSQSRPLYKHEIDMQTKEPPSRSDQDHGAARSAQQLQLSGTLEGKEKEIYIYIYPAKNSNKITMGEKNNILARARAHNNGN